MNIKPLLLYRFRVSHGHGWETTSTIATSEKEAISIVRKDLLTYYDGDMFCFEFWDARPIEKGMII